MRIVCGDADTRDGHADRCDCGEEGEPPVDAPQARTVGNAPPEAQRKTVMSWHALRGRVSLMLTAIGR
ncbi:hypothetical protein C1S80_14840 [Mycolicibacterium aubagnense]|nr:hypothetical protein C1S80_14840 [Mycolicibacterium aubagnense]